MSSGVEVSQEVVKEFQALVTKRQYRGAIFKISGDYSKIEIDQTFAPSASSKDAQADWVKVVKTLPDSDCRYIAYDFPYEHQGSMKNKVLFVTWAPEISKVRSKMLYASSKDGLLQKLEGVQRSIQCTDDDEIEYAAVAKLLSSHTAGY